MAYFLRLFLIAIVLWLILIIYKFHNSDHRIHLLPTNFTEEKLINIPVFVWWTPFTGLSEIKRECQYGSCIFTEDRNHEGLLHGVKGFIFYGSDFKVEDLPLPRRSDEWWALLHEESPKNQPIFNHQPAMSLFNLTSTFKSASNMPLTLQYLQNTVSLTSRNYFKPTREKDGYINEEKISPIIYLQSDCNSPSERDNYVKEIAKYISVDSYGSCVNNRKLPENLKGIDSFNSPEILNLISRYKFTIAFENSACNDYITEKLWRPLVAGSVPIYWGSSSVTKWLPNNSSIIHVRDFDTSRDLTYYLQKLLENNTSYESYLKHKLYGIIENEELVKTLEKRSWGINEDQETKGTFVEAFECFACDTVLQYQDKPGPNSVVANVSHYGCPLPETMLKTSEVARNFWSDQWYKSEAESYVLHQLINQYPGTFNMEVFHTCVLDYLHYNGYFNNFSYKEL